MQTAPALRQVTADLIARLAGEGVCYAELRFALSLIHICGALAPC